MSPLQSANIQRYSGGSAEEILEEYFDKKVIADKLYEKILHLKNASSQTMYGTEVAALFLKCHSRSVRSRRHQMCLYTGPTDVIRINVADYTEEELRAEVRRLTHFSQEDSISLVSIQVSYELHRLLAKVIFSFDLFHILLLVLDTDGFSLPC
jgi:hypothetical protein